jgi:hypothetical protein
MITDAQTRLSLAQPVLGATVVSANTWDGLSPRTNIGIGQDRRFYAKVSTAFVGGTSLQVQIIQSANANLSAPDVLLSGPVVLLATLIAGAVLLDVVAPQNTKQYLGVQYVPVGTFTGGTVEAHILSDVDHQLYPPSNTGY